MNRLDEASKAVLVKEFSNRCLLCKHWADEERESILSFIQEFPEDMNAYLGIGDYELFGGWAPSGECWEIQSSIDIEVYAGWNGGGVESIETEPTFGCILFKHYREEEA